MTMSTGVGRGSSTGRVWASMSEKDRIAWGKHISASKKAKSRTAWNKGVHCPRSKDAARRSAETFKRRYALGEICKRVKYPNPVYVVRAGDGVRVRLRSTWEAAFAKCLDAIGACWRYEPRRFSLPDGGSWTPDFLVVFPKRLRFLFGRAWEFVEIKGWEEPVFRTKYELFKITYPNIPIRLLMGDGMRDLVIMAKHYRYIKMEPRERKAFKVIDAEMDVWCRRIWSQKNKGKS